ncbi:MAG: HxsD-like protein [Deltaproteobacteria bacterium]|nr:HxsD-like protein [Deltaproteobacteria bacterium]
MSVLQLHQGLYSRAATDEAIKLFGEAARIVLSEVEPYYRLEIDAIDEEDDVEAITAEFANYVLALTVEEKRAGHPD